MNGLERLNKLDKEKQFLTSHFGEKKLTKLIAAFDKFCDENKVAPYEIKDIASFYRKVNRLP